MREHFGERRRITARYLFLSAATGVIELGPVIYAARSGWPLPAALSLGLAYQIAALFVRPFQLRPADHRYLLSVGVVAGASVSIAPGALIPIALVSTAIGLQGVRDEQLSRVRVGTPAKRTARIAGFVTAAAFSPWFFVVLPAVVLGVAFATPQDLTVRHERRLHRLRFNRHAVLMVIHQSHYFMYAYTLLCVLVDLFAPSAIQAAMAFGAGWITYTLAPLLFGRLRPLPVLVSGHLVVACVLGIIAYALDDRRVVTLAWVIGGLGGGTVFCIKLLASRLPGFADELDSWENIGHVVGSAAAIGIATVLPVQAIFIAAGGLAATTAIVGSFAAASDGLVQGVLETLESPEPIETTRRGPGSPDHADQGTWSPHRQPVGRSSTARSRTSKTAN